MILAPISINEANRYVARWHRYHKPSRGGLFALAAFASPDALEPCGVAIVGRPVARMLQSGRACEVLRLATDGTPNANSFLLAACRRAAQAQGYRRVLTYTLASESKASLRAVGARPSGTVRGSSWHRLGRPRGAAPPPTREHRFRWDLVLDFDGSASGDRNANSTSISVHSAE